LACCGPGVSTANNVMAIGISAENVSNSCYIGQIYSNVQPQVGTDRDLMTMTAMADLAERSYVAPTQTDIQPIHKAGKAIYALKPVSFRYNKQYDATQTIAFGLIAEEVPEVNSDLVGTQSRLTAQICSLRTNQRDASQ
jgi:Chaperone of endosialidase